MRKHFCAVCLLYSVIYISLLLMMSWHWFRSNSCTVVFMTNKNITVNVLKISTHCFLFLQNAYKCSYRPITYDVEVVPEHVYMSRLMTKQTNDCPPSHDSDLSLRWAPMPFSWFCHEAAHIAMMGSLRQHFYPRMRKAGRDRKISDSYRKGYSSPMCENGLSQMM